MLNRCSASLVLVLPTPRSSSVRSLSFFSIVNCFSSRVERRLGPRLTTLIGAVFFCLGYIIASFSKGNMLVMIIGLGIFTSIGMALAYITIIAVVNKWLPHNSGLATGIAMSGFGGGAVLVANIAQPLLGRGMDVLSVFRPLGIILGGVYFISALLLTNPPWEKHSSLKQPFHFSYTRILSDRRYWVLNGHHFLRRPGAPVVLRQPQNHWEFLWASMSGPPLWASR